jgi:hypothetical protein
LLAVSPSLALVFNLEDLIDVFSVERAHFWWLSGFATFEVSLPHLGLGNLISRWVSAKKRKSIAVFWFRNLIVKNSFNHSWRNLILC